MLACGETGPKTSAPGPQVAHPWLKVLKIKRTNNKFQLLKIFT